LNLLATAIAWVAVGSTAYCLVSIWADWRFFAQKRRSDRSDRADMPPVSILKPLKGADPGMYESLRSHCTQNYPHYEVLFGVSDHRDPAAEIVQKLMDEFSQPRIRLIICEHQLGANGKVSALATLATFAAHDFLLVNDSDIRLEPDFLRSVTVELRRPSTGLVTCLYRAVARESLGSRLESLGVNTDFAAGVLVARELENGLRFALGGAMVFRRSDLEAIGGFKVLADYLADDYELGRRVCELGRRVELSRSIVETHLPAYAFRAFFAHQLRWARTIRAARPAGYAGLLLTFTVPWAILTLALRPGAIWARGLFSIALVLRAAMALVTSRLVLGDRQVLRSFWLLPLRDLMAVAVWVAAWFGGTVVWRGQRFRLVRGRLKRIASL
jgi:ceramide glucosyltransferase